MANKTHIKGNIYSLARVAKERLKQNNYTKTNSTKINNASSFVTYISNQKKSKQEITKQKVIDSSYDEKLYQKLLPVLSLVNILSLL